MVNQGELVIRTEFKDCTRQISRGNVQETEKIQRTDDPLRTDTYKFCTPFKTESPFTRLHPGNMAPCVPMRTADRDSNKLTVGKTVFI